VLCERVRDEEDVLAVVDALAGALDLPFPLGPDGDAVLVTASIGIATAQPGAGADPESLVRDADIAMYRAKERGRARFEIFDEEMRDRATARLQTQNDLRTALERHEVRVHFQPVVDPSTGVVLSTEALARWDHPTRGLLLPGDFIPHAEETGLILALGAAVLAEACVVTARWNRSRPVPLAVAVNLSARQLGHPDLLGVVSGALRDSGLPPRLLCLEVTETVVMEDAEASARVLAQLRALGVRIAIDDFGTGYSSLAYLLSLPVDVVKVDRSFVAAVDGFGPGTAIVTAVLALAGTLGLDVVAEGVETVEQRDVLLDLGVRAAQGWLWGRAVDADAAGWAAAGGRLDAGSLPAVALPEARVPWPDDTSTRAGGATWPTTRP
jgi:EAL domain-containing protein (putative c-di-GMP-specific phosphodiesterase class I)